METENENRYTAAEPYRERGDAARQIAVAVTALLALTAAVLFSAALLLLGIGAIPDGTEDVFLRGNSAPVAHRSEETEDASPPDAAPDDDADDLAADDGMIRVSARDFSAAAVPAIKNRTSYEIDPDELLDMPSDVESPGEIYKEYGKTAPVVLIVHTHGTEAYRGEDQTDSEPGDDFRSDDPLNAVVSVGDVLAEVLVGAGINTMHCTVMFDKPSYSGAYAAEAKTVRELVEKYPSIRYVIDVHRDALIEDDVNYAAVTEIGGVSYAQFSMVIGTDEGGAKHPGWKKCLSAAVKLQTVLAADYPTLVRSISLRSASYNAQYAPVSLLMEFGTCGNTLREAKRTAVLVGEKLAELILGDGEAVSAGAVLERFA